MNTRAIHQRAAAARRSAAAAWRKVCLPAALFALPGIFALSCNQGRGDFLPPRASVQFTSQPAGLLRGNVPVAFSLFEPNKTRTSITVSYSTDGGATFKSATEEGAPGTSGTFKLSTNRTGITYRFVWDSVADLGLVGVTTARLRIQPEGGDAVTTGAFQVRNSFSAGQRLFCTLRAANLVAVIDADSLEIVDYIPTGAQPRGMAAYQSGGIDFLAVANHDADTLTIIDLSTHEVAKTITVGDGPVDVVYGPGTSGGDYLFVVNELADSITPVRVDVGNVLAAQTAVSVGDGPVAAAFYTTTAGARFVAVANAADDTVSIIDADTRAVTQTPAVGDDPRDVLFVSGIPAGDVLFVPTRGDDRISLLDAANSYANVIDTPLVAGDGPAAVARGTAFSGNTGDTSVYVLHETGREIRVYRYDSDTPNSGREYQSGSPIAAPASPVNLVLRSDAGTETLYYTDSGQDRVLAMRVTSDPPVSLGAVSLGFRGSPDSLLLR